MAKHLGHIKVERLLAVRLHETEVCIASCLADNIHRGTLTLCNLLHMLKVFLVNEKSHALLRLVGNNLLCAQGLVTDWQFRHVYRASTLLDQLRQTVQVACRAMVVNAHYRIVVLLYQCSHEVVGALLHFGVGTLHGIKLYAVAVASCVYG